MRSWVTITVDLHLAMPPGCLFIDTHSVSLHLALSSETTSCRGASPPLLRCQCIPVMWDAKWAGAQQSKLVETQTASCKAGTKQTHPAFANLSFPLSREPLCTVSGDPFDKQSGLINCLTREVKIRTCTGCSSRRMALKMWSGLITNNRTPKSNYWG